VNHRQGALHQVVDPKCLFDSLTFGLEVLFQAQGNAIGQRHDGVFLIFALAYVDCFPLEIHIVDLQVDDFLPAHAGGVDQCEHYPMFEKGRGGKEFFEFSLVENDRQFGFFFERRQGDGIFVHPHQAVVIAQPVNHVLETAARGRFGVAGEGGEEFVDLLGVDLFRKHAETNHKQSDAADIII
jgi:hypothetical protein